MFLTYLKIVLRNIRRQKGCTAINIVGLAVSIVCFGKTLCKKMNNMMLRRPSVKKRKCHA